MHSVREVIASPLLGLSHPQWAEAYPWLWQGCTTRGSGTNAYDFGLFSGGSEVADLFSHRRGDGGRQVGYVGVRP
jgi:hypothetical protein